MKKLIIIASALLAAGVASCSKTPGGGKPDTPPATGRELTITANAPTRAGIDGTSVYWSTGDKIEVYYAKDGGATVKVGTFTLDPACNGKDYGNFTGMIDALAAEGNYYSSLGWMTNGNSAIASPPGATCAGIEIETVQTQNGVNDPASLGRYSRFWADCETLAAAPTSGTLHFTFRPLTCILDIPLVVKPGEKVKKVTVTGGQGNPQSDYPAHTLPFMAEWCIDKATSTADNLKFGTVTDDDIYKSSVSVTMVPAQTSDFTASIVIFPRDMPAMVALGSNGAQSTPRDLEIVVTADNAAGEEITYTIDKSGTPMCAFLPGKRYPANTIDLSAITADPQEVFNENIYTDPTPAGVSQYTLDNPNAIPNAKNLYNYLCDLSKKGASTDKLIIGYYIGAAYRSDVLQEYPFSMSEPTEIRRRTGKWVGMLDAWICPGVYPDNKSWDPFKDCMWYDQIVADYRLWWMSGGICHAGASPYCPSFSSTLFSGRYGQRFNDNTSGCTSLNYANLVTPGTVENGRWRALLDHIATFFLELQKYGIPVIYRPFTESYIGGATGSGSGYWYSSCPWGDRTNPANAWPMTNAQFKALWKDEHDYLTNVKGCNNIIWDFQCRTHDDTHYPGEALVDLLGGESDYVNWQPNANPPNVYRTGDLNPGDMPVGNGELGNYGVSADVAKETPDRVGKYSWESYVQTISQTAPRMVFCSVWDRKFGPVKFPAVTSTSFSYPDYDAGFNAAINHPYALTRERLKGTPVPPQLPFKMVFSDDRPMPVTYMGKWSYQEGALVRTDAANRSVAVYGNTEWTDYTASATLAAPATGEAGLIGRCTSVTEYYSLSVGGGTLKLCKYVNYKNNAVYTPITLASAAFDPQGADVMLTLTFAGAAITAKAEIEGGVQVQLTATDDGISSGCTGVFAQNTTTRCGKLEIRSEK